MIERFFLDRAASVLHELSPHAGGGALDLLCTRNYRPMEISNVLYRSVEQPPAEHQDHLAVRVIGPKEAPLWTSISARGWADEHPELLGFLLQLGSISGAREQSLCLRAEVDGNPGAAGMLCMHNEVALFGGSATVPELQHHGLQNAHLQGRMRYAFGHGCDLAMMVVAQESTRTSYCKLLPVRRFCCDQGFGLKRPLAVNWPTV